MQKELRSRLGKPIKVDYRELVDFQPENLKKTSKKRIEKLKKSLLDIGFVSPFLCWRQGDRIYTIDGHHRRIALAQLEAEGVKIPKLMAVPVEAENAEEAHELILVYASRSSEFTAKGLADFTANMNIGDLKAKIDIPNLKIRLSDTPKPKKRRKAKTKPGDIYELGPHKLLCGETGLVDIDQAVQAWVNSTGKNKIKKNGRPMTWSKNG